MAQRQRGVTAYGSTPLIIFLIKDFSPERRMLTFEFYKSYYGGQRF